MGCLSFSSSELSTSMGDFGRWETAKASTLMRAFFLSSQTSMLFGKRVTGGSCILRVAATTTHCDATCGCERVLCNCARCCVRAATSLLLCCQWMRASFLSEGCGSTLGITKLCGKGVFASSASSICSFRCASVGAIHKEYNDASVSFPTSCCPSRCCLPFAACDLQ